MKRRITFLLAGLILLASLTVNAGEITGAVRDGFGKALGNVTVVAINKGSQKSTFTTDSGIYYLNPLPAGTYMVIAQSLDGLRDTITGVQITEDNTVEVNLFIGVSKYVTPDFVFKEHIDESTNSLIDRFSSGSSYISPNEIKHAGIKKVADMVATTGKSNVSDNGDISLGGGRPTSTRTMIDGVYTIAPISIPANSIQYLRVYSGGIPAKYGDSSGGVIVIETKSYFNQ
jgi:hypothetical protein